MELFKSKGEKENEAIEQLKERFHMENISHDDYGISRKLDSKN